MANTSSLFIPGTLRTLILSRKTQPSSEFSNAVLVSNYRGCKGEAIKLILYDMIDVIYKAAKPSDLKNLQTIYKYLPNSSCHFSMH